MQTRDRQVFESARTWLASPYVTPIFPASVVIGTFLKQLSSDKIRCRFLLRFWDDISKELAVSNPLTAPMTVFAPYARWTFVGPSGRPSVVYQEKLFEDHARLNESRVAELGLVEKAHALLLTHPDDWRSATLEVPRQRDNPAKAGRDPAGKVDDPLAAVLYAFWPDLVVEDDVRSWTARHRAKRFTRAVPGPRFAWEWVVWYDLDRLEGSFRNFDKHGKPIPAYDLDRRPLRELADALMAPRDIAKLIGF